MLLVVPQHDSASDPPKPRRKLKRREILCSWRFLTFSCYHRYQLLGTPAIRDVFVDALWKSREKHRFRLIAWVVMPDHVHLTIVPRVVVGYDNGWPLVASTSTVEKIYATMKKSVSQRVLARWTKLNAPILPKLTLADGTRHFWQPGGGFDRNVRTEAEAWREICYIHDNPVRRKLATRAEEWPWSSARWYAGETEGQIPIDNDRGITPWRAPEEWVRDAVRIHPMDKG